MKTIYINKSIRVFVLIGLCLVCMNANAGKLYKWVDAQGNVSYQDQPPPKGSKILSEKEVAIKNNESNNSANNALPELKIYTVKGCDLCDKVVSLMRRNKVAHIELSLQDDRDAQQMILDKVGSLKAPTLLIDSSVYQHSSIKEFSSELSKAGYTIAEEAPASENKTEDKSS